MRRRWVALLILFFGLSRWIPRLQSFPNTYYYSGLLLIWGSPRVFPAHSVRPGLLLASRKKIYPKRLAPGGSACYPCRGSKILSPRLGALYSGSILQVLFLSFDTCPLRPFAKPFGTDDCSPRWIYHCVYSVHSLSCVNEIVIRYDNDPPGACQNSSCSIFIPQLAHPWSRSYPHSRPPNPNPIRILHHLIPIMNLPTHHICIVLTINGTT